MANPFSAVAFAFLAATAPALAEQYLCVPDKATGFIYNRTTKEWDYARLKTSHFVIGPPKSEKEAYSVTDVGIDALPGWCEKGFTDAGILYCQTFGGELKFNRVTGRFIRTFDFAYYTVGIPGPARETDEDSGTPMIEIGKCTAF